ncbi:hypothetical protein GCM10028806_33210 [Spirosoma terrae]|uniref:Uncharacterized protein n=1 Tax=Spirosoma terrae TaxID=1968276 RepID=A0A6L9L4T6_9BACT|nr:hypothetical protein [Spirosoma terrae]NDU95635.1 hypothetical protein [Spirosoma terrae]
MKTYAESQGQKPFDWWKALKTPMDLIPMWKTLWDLSSDWVTDACGYQSNLITRDVEGRPKDPELEILGFDFSRAVGEAFQAATNHHQTKFGIAVQQAQAYLHEIEKRAEFLLNQLDHPTHD